MYNYRNMTPEEQARILEYRRQRNQPWHSPPHWRMGMSHQYLMTAACYEHAPIIGRSLDRMTACETDVLSVCRERGSEVDTWCFLPNHYHLLIGSERLKELCWALGRFHGRSSFTWNREDGQRGRKVWYRCFDREIRSERHYWASVNYIHHNPVHHGYTEKWQDWPWSSATEFLNEVGREQAMKIWRAYPILDYGKTWDVEFGVPPLGGTD
jgi:putative transposase